MTIRVGLISWATCALALAPIAACGQDDEDASPPQTVSSSPSAPTTSASPPPPSDAATADASKTIRTYFRVVDEIRRDPADDDEKLRSVATSAQLNALQTLVRRQDENGHRQTGTTAISELTVQSVSLDNSDPAGGKVPTVVIDVCWDVGKVDVLDKSGKSIVTPDRPDSGWTRYSVANYEYAADPSGGWRVATGQDLQQTPCVGS